MAYSISDLQFTSLVVHGTQICYVILDDPGSKTTRKQHWYLFNPM